MEVVEPEIEEKKPRPTVSDMMFEAQPCEPNMIMTKIKQARLWSDKKKIIVDTIANCAPKCKSKKKRGGGTKKSSGWICYNKHCAKDTGKKYMACVADKERAKKEYFPKKDHWNEQYLKGCPL